MSFTATASAPATSDGSATHPFLGDKCPSSPSPSPSSFYNKTNAKLIRANRERSIVRQLVDQSDAFGLVVGDVWYVLSARWWQHWKEFVRYDEATDDTSNTNTNTNTTTEEESVMAPGPIDNSDIQRDENDGQGRGGCFALGAGGVKAGNNEDESAPDTVTPFDVLLKPQLQQAQDFELIPLEAWKALHHWYGGGAAIARKVIATSDGGAQGQGSDDLLVDLYPLERKKQQEAMLLEEKLLREAEAEAQAEKEKEEEEEKGKSERVRHCSACFKTPAPKRCSRCKSVFYCSAQCQKSHWKFHRTECKPLSEKEAREKAAGATSSQNQGKCGLKQLGNTCFMNSVIQCLSHARPLNRYFLSGDWEAEQNRDSPLGANGNMAKAWADLMQELWHGSRRAVAPVALKRVVGKFAPRFSGFQQQDAHELLTYMIDALHEDLCRIKKKPYVEEEESDGRPDDVVSKEAWKKRLLRDDSAINDLFYGQFKSTVICPECDRRSIKFDPVPCLQLSLPQNSTRIIMVVVAKQQRVGKGKKIAPAEGFERYALRVDKNSRVKSLMLQLSEKCGIPPEQLVLTDIFKGKLFKGKTVPFSRPVSKIRNDDVLVAYEIPVSSNNVPLGHTFVYHLPPNESGHPTGIPALISFKLDQRDAVLGSSALAIRRHLFARMQPSYSSRTMLQSQEVSDICRQMPLIVVDPNCQPISTAGLDDVSDGEDGVFPSEDTCDGAALLRSEEHAFTYLAFLWDENWIYNASTKSGVFDVEALFDVQDHESVGFEDAMQKRGGQAMNLEDLLRNESKPEELDKDNEWYCSNCKKHQLATKQLQLWRSPDILVIQLKRFYHRNIIFKDKLDAPVNFPTEGLDMAPHCISTGVADADGKHFSGVYDLFAVCNHYGRMGFGHYTAYARNLEGSEPNQWYEFNDAQVSKMDAGNVVSRSAYILFYARRKKANKEGSA